MNNFHYVAVLLDQLYSIEMEDEELEELGLIAWEHIGNKTIKLYKYSTWINSDLSITLPCNVYKIEAVTTSYEDWEEVSNKHSFGNQNSSYVENSIEAEKHYQSPYYIPGKLLKYEEVGDKLYFSHNYGKINILYKGLLLDDEGLPELTDKEAQAIATYLAYVIKFKEGLKTNNPNIIKLSETLYQVWSKQCDQAKVTKLSQNDMNNILDVKSSWGRHVYSKSYKPIL